MLADLFNLLATLKTVHASLDHEQRKPLVRVLVGARCDDHKIGIDAVSDECLGPVEDVRIAVELGARLDRCQVRPGARLGHGDRKDQLSRSDAGEPSVALFLGCRRHQIRQNDVGVQPSTHHRIADSGVGRFLSENDVETPVVYPAAAVLLWHIHGKKSVLCALGEELARHDAGSLPIFGIRHNLGLKESREAFTVGLVLGFEEVALGCCWSLDGHRVCSFSGGCSRS